MIQYWTVYGLQLLFVCCIAAMLLVFRFVIQKSRPPKNRQSSEAKPIANSFRFHYHLGFVLSFAFLILGMMLLPFVQVLGKQATGDMSLKSRAFFSLLMACFFLILGISYGVKKGDFKWKRPE